MSGKYIKWSNKKSLYLIMFFIWFVSEIQSVCSEFYRNLKVLFCHCWFFGVPQSSTCFVFHYPRVENKFCCMSIVFLRWFFHPKTLSRFFTVFFSTYMVCKSLWSVFLKFNSSLGKTIFIIWEWQINNVLLLSPKSANINTAFF